MKASRYPMPTSARCWGLGMSFTFASSMVTQVPSVPTSARATLNCSGSRSSRLQPGKSLFRVELEDPIHILGEIEHYGDIAALPGQAGACSACQDGGPVFAAGRHGSDHVVCIAWDD